VRDARLYLKTLQGLRPVHGLIKRLDDQFLDPLELRPDSTLGVPGLLQAIRAGNVLVANMPGSAFLESPALLGFLPALSRHGTRRFAYKRTPWGVIPFAAFSPIPITSLRASPKPGRSTRAVPIPPHQSPSLWLHREPSF